MIKIQDYNKEEEKISFVTDMSIGLANSIRRSALEIPIRAIDEVEITKNDSALYDEIIAHRLGLVPIKTNKVDKEMKLKLHAKGPSIVYSTDLKPNLGNDFKLPVVILDEEQEIELVAHTKLGTGIEHIKYSPGLIYYKHNLSPEIIDFVHIDEEGKVNYHEEELKDKKLSEEQINKIKNTKEINELVFTIESWGQIEVKEIFFKAIEVLDKNLQELAKLTK